MYPLEIMSNNRNNENNLSTAVETIKLLGEHVLELREVIDTQRDEIASLKSEFVKLYESCRELSGDFKLARIDQKDLAKQLKEIKRSALESHQAQPKADLPAYEDIVKRYYPGYAQNPDFSHELRSKAIKQQPKPQMQSKSDETGFNFARLPKFLNLD